MLKISSSVQEHIRTLWKSRYPYDCSFCYPDPNSYILFIFIVVYVSVSSVIDRNCHLHLFLFYLSVSKQQKKQPICRLFRQMGCSMKHMPILFLVFFSFWESLPAFQPAVCSFEVPLKASSFHPDSSLKEVQ